MILINIPSALFLVAWTAVPAGEIPNDLRHAPSEPPGARSLGLANIGSVWFGVFTLALYLLIAS